MSVFGCLADYGNVIDASDVDAVTFRKIMCFVYKEDIIIRSVEEASNLLYTATKYKISALDKHCEKYLMRSISHENVHEVMVIADTYKLAALKRMCKLFLSKANPELPPAWVRFGPNQFSESAVVAGYSGDGLPICIGRCIYEENILPGSVDLTDETITVTHEGQVVKLKKYETLCNGNLYWSRSNLSHVISDAVSGGTTELGKTLYVGRTIYDGVLKMGKISSVNDTLYISDGSMEVAVEGPYEVLIEKPFNRMC